MVRCDAPTGKEADCCKASFAVTMGSFAATPAEVIAAARSTNPRWYLDESGRAFCPSCVVMFVRLIEEARISGSEIGDFRENPAGANQEGGA